MRRTLKRFSLIPARPPVPRGQAGLTLIEILVVLAIIAVMAYLIVPNVIGRPDQARATVARTDLRTISASLKMYRLDNGDYPTTEQGLKALATRPSSEPAPANWSPNGYLEQVPIDPWGRPYTYRSPAENGEGFEILSLGKDGRAGGDGVDQDIAVVGR
ncbi:MAG: type II secretion system major pseudopilin GspG [Novosphingobium sp.]